MSKVNVTISNGVAVMTQKGFEELKENGMIVYSGGEPRFLYRGYANKITIKERDRTPEKGKTNA